MKARKASNTPTAPRGALSNKGSTSIIKTPSSSPKNANRSQRCWPWAVVWLTALAVGGIAYGKVYSNLDLSSGSVEEALQQFRHAAARMGEPEPSVTTAGIITDNLQQHPAEQEQRHVTDKHSRQNKKHDKNDRVSLTSTNQGHVAAKVEPTNQRVHDQHHDEQPQVASAATNEKMAEAPASSSLSNNPSCFPYNSPRWLQGPRHGNIQEDLVTDDFVAQMILGWDDQQRRDNQKDAQHVHTALSQSLCFDQSRFRNSTDTQGDDRSIQLWMVRITYLAMHRVQHQFALPEARVRLERREECRQQAQHLGIGPLDYECPDAQFFVVAIENLGLGAVIRTTVVSGLLAALATNRTVLFVNHAPTRENITDAKGQRPRQPLPIIRQDWYHGSCERKDVQCFFQLPSPCVLTYDQLAQAPALNNSKQVANFFKNPTRSIQMEPFRSERAIILPVRTVTRSVPPNIPGVLRDFTLHYAAGHNEPLRGVLTKVADRFVDETQTDKVKQLIGYGLVLYALRPNLASGQKLKQVLEQVVPPHAIQPEVTLGLPIRASDKCVEESECLAFDQYMRVLTQTWNRNKDQLSQKMKEYQTDALNIILTTESESVIREKDVFMANITLRQNVPFPFRFITNDYDIKQDNGNPQNNLEDAIDPHGLSHTAKPVDADEVMLSMVSSLKAQLMARYSIGNCCSNFHRILFEMLDGGCGAAYQGGPECLQTNENPEFRICCIWDNSEECKAKGVGQRLQNNIDKVKKRKMEQRRKKRLAQQQQQQDRVE